MRSGSLTLAIMLSLPLALAAHAADAKAAPPAKPAPAAAAKAAPAKTISGTVVGTDAKPIAGAIVRIIPMPPKADGSIRGMRVPDVPKAVTGKTDAAGAFKIEVAGGGSMVVRVESPGLAPALASDVPAGAALNLRLKPGVSVAGRVIDLLSQRPIAGAGVSAIERDAARFGKDAAHTVQSGEDGTFLIKDCAQGVVIVDAIAPAKARATLDRVVAAPLAPGEERKPEANTLYLQPGGRIAGRVVGPDGKAVADAIVTASGSDGSLLKLLKDSREAKRSDADGKFTFDGVLAGNKYTVRATKEGFGSHEEGPIPIEAGTERGDLEMKLDAAASLTFRLVTAKDVPVKDVDVRLQTQGGATGGRRRGFAIGAGDVDRDKIVAQGDGKFLVKGLDSGTFDLTLQPADFSDVTKEGLRLKSGETVDLGTLRVKESKSVSGRITDATGQPVEGATIFGMSMDADFRLSREARSGADGRYRISGLGDSPVRNLSVRATGFAEASREGATPGDTDVDFSLEKTGSIVGKVLLRGAAAPPAFRVQAFPEAKENQERPGFRVMISSRPDDDQVFTDPSGNFRLDNVNPGTVTITAKVDGKAPARKTGLKVVSEQVTDVGTLTVEDGRALRGRVVASKDDAPIAGATIVVSQPQGFTMRMGGADQSQGAAISTLDGHFEIAGLEARTYAIDASQPEYSPNSGRVDISADADTDDFVIKLSRGGTITGLVRDAQKVPLPNAGVLLTKMGGGGGPQTATTGPDGRYTFEKITPGDYIVIKAPQGGAVMLFGGMKQVTVQEGETTNYDIDEASKITVTGRVLKGGQPVPNAMLLFTGDGESASVDLKQSRSDADGHYQIGLDTAGAYRVVVSTGGMFMGRQAGVAVQVPDQPNPVVDVTLRSAGINGKVVNQDGKPVSGAMISATPSGANSANGGHGGGGLLGQSEPDGSFSLDGLTAGTYSISVTASGYRIPTVPPVTIANDSDVQTVDINLEPGRTVRGHVLDAGGNGIASAMVLTAPSGTSTAGDDLRAMSDVNGAFVITAPAEGPIDITAIADGYPPARAVSVQPEDVSDVPVRAPRPGRVRVSVIDSHGNAVEGASVSCRAVPGFLGADFMRFGGRTPATGRDGVTTVSALAPGGYELTATSQARHASQSVSLTEGGEAVTTITLP